MYFFIWIGETMDAPEGAYGVREGVGESARQPRMWRQRMWSRNTASAGNAASGENEAPGNADAASECEVSVRWQSAGPLAAALTERSNYQQSRRH